MGKSRSAESPCGHCGKPTKSLCSGCKAVAYCGPSCQKKDWKEGGHKVFCKDLPRAIAEAEAAIDRRPLDSFRYRSWGSAGFGLSEAQEARGEIVEEESAQNVCYDAMEEPEASPEKVKLVISALKTFPLSTEAWGMLGAHFRWDLPEDRQDLDMAQRMYDNAIKCARRLNPTWQEDRRKRLEWGLMYTRPYLRAVHGRAMVLHRKGDVSGAIREAKLLLKWNPSDNQGVRQMLCVWMLEAGDVEGCLNVFRQFDVSGDTSLAYTDVLLQFQRWERGDVTEEDVQQALSVALRSNMYVPDLLLADDFKGEKFDYLDCDGPKAANSYVQDGHRLWKKYPTAMKWLEKQKYLGGRVPGELELISLLRNERKVFIHCTSEKLEGGPSKLGTMPVTQARDKCFGCGCDDFYWPPELNRQHEVGGPIYLHMQDSDEDDFDERGSGRWWKTSYDEVREVPFWMILTEYPDEEE